MANHKKTTIVGYSNLQTMKQLFFVTIIILMSLTTFSQKKKQIKKYKISCVSVTDKEGSKTMNDSKTFYNAFGDMTTEMDYDKVGKLESTTKFKYSGSDLIEEIKYDGQNAVIEKRTYKYNFLGEKSEETLIDKTGKIIKRLEYFYNDKGLKTERRSYDAANKLVSVRKYDYNCK